MENEYQKYLAVSPEGLSEDKFLEWFGNIINLSNDLQKKEGLEKAVSTSRTRTSKFSSGEKNILFNYFLSNAWSGLLDVETGVGKRWSRWDSENIEKTILHLRIALRHEDFSKIHSLYRCQILTNLGNIFDSIGRFVEALEFWERALEIDPNFGMALGNKGIALRTYAGILYNRQHAWIFADQARIALGDSLKKNDIHERAKNDFSRNLEELEKIFENKEFKVNFDKESISDTDEERTYREWVLNNRLFLNPINDLGARKLAAEDVLSTPDMTTEIGVGPYIPRFFDQIKQEYVSGRFLLYEGLNQKGIHYSDKKVSAYDFGDHSAYSLAVEKTKAAFRIAYSLFDKIAFLLNDYFDLNIDHRSVSFKRIWFVGGDKNLNLNPIIANSENWPLRGLYWLNKDLYSSDDEFGKYIDPDAQELDKLRNRLEHRYLRLHNSEWSGESSTLFKDRLAFSMYRSDFENKTLRLYKLIRSAMTYVSLSIHISEKRKREKKTGKSLDLKLENMKDDQKI